MWWSRLLGLDAQDEASLAAQSNEQDQADLRRVLHAREVQFAEAMDRRRKVAHVTLGRDLGGVSYRLALQDLLRSFTQVTAGTGAGKSRWVASVMLQLARQHPNVAVILFDLKGELAELLLRAFAAEALHREGALRDAWLERLVVLRVFEGAWLPELQMLAQEPSLDPLTQAHAMADVLAGAAEADLGIRQQAALTMLFTLAIERGWDLLTLRALLHEVDALQHHAARSCIAEVRQYFASRFARESALTIDGIAARFDVLLRVQALKAAFVGPGMFDWKQCFVPGTFTVLSLGNPPLGAEGAKRMMASLLLTRLIWALFDARRTPSSALLVMDEVQEALQNKHCQELLARAVTTGRSYGLAAISVHQSALQLGSLQELLDTNGRFRVIGRSGERDGRLAAQWLPQTGLVPRSPKPGQILQAHQQFLRPAEEREYRIRALGTLACRHFLVADRLAPFGARTILADAFDPPAWTALPEALVQAVQRGRCGTHRSELLSRVQTRERASVAAPVSSQELPMPTRTRPGDLP